MEGDAAAFMGAIHGSGYLYAVKVLEIVAGALLLIGKRVPLAVTLITPVVVNILLFHIFMAMDGLPFALLLLVLNAILLYAHRDTFGKVIAAD